MCVEHGFVGESVSTEKEEEALARMLLLFSFSVCRVRVRVRVRGCVTAWCQRLSLRHKRAVCQRKSLSPSLSPLSLSPSREDRVVARRVEEEGQMCCRPVGALDLLPVV